MVGSGGRCDGAGSRLVGGHRPAGRVAAAARRPEHPAAEQQEPDHGGQQVGHDQHRRSRPAGSARGWNRCSRASEPLVRARPSRKTPKPWNWCRTASGAAADAEGEPAVGRGVGDRGQRQRQEVRRLRARHGRGAAGTAPDRPAC